MQLRPERFGLILKWAEYGYAGLLIFTLTQGPVLSLWYASEQQGLSPAIGPHLATYFLIQIPALLAVSRKSFTTRDLKGPIGVLALFCFSFLRIGNFSIKISCDIQFENRRAKENCRTSSYTKILVWFSLPRVPFSFSGGIKFGMVERLLNKFFSFHFDKCLSNF